MLLCPVCGTCPSVEFAVARDSGSISHDGGLMECRCGGLSLWDPTGVDCKNGCGVALAPSRSPGIHGRMHVNTFDPGILRIGRDEFPRGYGPGYRVFPETAEVVEDFVRELIARAVLQS